MEVQALKAHIDLRFEAIEAMQNRILSVQTSVQPQPQLEPQL